MKKAIKKCRFFHKWTKWQGISYFKGLDGFYQAEHKTCLRCGQVKNRIQKMNF